MQDDIARRAGERLEEFVEQASQAPPEGAEAARSVAAGIPSRADDDLPDARPQRDRDPWGGTRVRRSATGPGVTRSANAGRAPRARLLVLPPPA